MIRVVQRRRMPTICQSQLLLKRQHATPVDGNLAGSGRDFYTWLTSRLLFWRSARPTSTHVYVEADRSTKE